MIYPKKKKDAGPRVVTGDASMSYRFTYFPSGPSEGAVNVGYVDRVHYVPLLGIAAASSAVSAPPPRPPVWDPLRLEARRLEARAQLRSLRASASPNLQRREREVEEPEPPPKRGGGWGLGWGGA